MAEDGVVDRLAKDAQNLRLGLLIAAAARGNERVGEHLLENRLVQRRSAPFVMSEHAVVQVVEQASALRRAQLLNPPFDQHVSRNTGVTDIGDIAAEPADLLSRQFGGGESLRVHADVGGEKSLAGIAEALR